MTKNILNDVDGYLIDLDGTIYVDDELIPGAVEFLHTLKQCGKRYLFLTNNSSKNAIAYVQKLKKMGICVQSDDIYTSGEATISYLQRRGARSGTLMYVVGTPDLEREFISAGYVLDESQPEYVVLGFDLTLTYAKLQRACTLVGRGVPFVATHPDWICPSRNDCLPDCGAMAALITAATGVVPHFVGKPYTDMVGGAERKLGISRNRLAMVGDRLYTDMRMASDWGLVGILVLSGETRIEDLVDCDVRPDLVLLSVAELSALIEK